jgi:broad specificity phosphatase PhoE
MKTITIIRHGQSQYNAGNFKVADCGLTDIGKQQAETLNEQFDVLVMSPLKRAIETHIYSNIKQQQIWISELFSETQKDSESNDDVRLRAKKAIQFIDNFKSNNIGIISHCNFIWHFLEELGHEPIKLSNCQSIIIDLS